MLLIKKLLLACLALVFGAIVLAQDDSVKVVEDILRAKELPRRSKFTLALSTDKKIYSCRDPVKVSVTWKNVSSDEVIGTYYDFFIFSFEVRDSGKELVFPENHYSMPENPPRLLIRPQESYKVDYQLDVSKLVTGTYSISVSEREAAFYAQPPFPITIEVVQ